MALPRIRARVAVDLRRAGLPREKVVAAIVRLLDSTLVRIGNAEYVRENASYGLTTLRKHHLRTEGRTLKLCFNVAAPVDERFLLPAPKARLHVLEVAAANVHLVMDPGRTAPGAATWRCP